MTKPFKPMLASPAEVDKLRFPLFASPKIDGIRGVVLNGELRTRKLLALPNRHTQARLSLKALDGFDGELVVGPPYGEDVMRRTTSGLMTIEGMPNYTFWVFDLHNHEGGYEKRLKALEKAATLYLRNTCQISVLPQKLIEHPDDLISFEERVVAQGYEGVIVRDPRAPYKYGRSTVREGYLLKIKRFEDGEAEVIGFEEELANTNEATKDELGHTKRSSAKAGKVGKGTLGAFIVRDLKTGVEFNVGGGLTALQRGVFWQRRDEYEGKIVKYKSFPVGVKEAPRHPVFLGFRDPSDMSE